VRAKRNCRTRRESSQIPNAEFRMPHCTNIVFYLFNSTIWIMMAKKQNNEGKMQLPHRHFQFFSAKANDNTIRIKGIKKEFN
jgi:hypothetical protein